MHNIVWTRRAVRNLDDIASYIATHDPGAAAKCVRSVAEKIAVLAYFPRAGRVGRVEGTRELVVTGTPYVVIYRVTRSVEILRVRHGARRWPNTPA